MENSEFRKHLRFALNHLHNRAYLRRSPLIALFGLASRFDGPAALQRILFDAIEALHPPSMEPLHSQKRRLYDILLYRYVQQFKQEDLAHQFGVSDRQFRREQDNAQEALATYLWKSHHLEQAVRMDLANPSSGSQAEPVNAEWDWITRDPSRNVVNVSDVIHDTLDLMKAVAGQSQVQIEFKPSDLPDLAVHPIALRQILLNLVQIAIHHARNGKVQITAAAASSAVELTIQTNGSGFPLAESWTEQDQNLIQTAQHLARISGGELVCNLDAGSGSCRLSLPTALGINVLVVDDNPEIIELLSRYTNLTRYHLVGIQDPEKAIEAAIQMGARIIVLDVMMPRVDGWELLGRIRRHPQTSGIPVLILTILAQEELARSLGARALVLKPVTQERFLAALDEIFEGMSSESR